MNDEIKEIKLDHFKNIEELKQNVETWIKEDEMYWDRWFNLYDLKTLLDYITNLQEENEDLKDRLKVMEHFKNSLQEENEKLKELCDKYEEEHSNEFKIWKNERHQILDYKSRCEKAIEYINKNKHLNWYVESIFTDELLNILNGGD